MIQLTGTLQNIAGGAAERGSVLLQLCGYGNQVPVIGSTALLAAPSSQDIRADSAGRFNVALYGNDAITPPGTYYTVTVKNANGDTVQVNAYRFGGPATTLDLSDARPFDPTGVAVSSLPIRDRLVELPAGPTPFFDGTAGLAFAYPLTVDVAPGAATFIAVPGNLYSFVLTQDGTGGHIFNWPAGVNGGSEISLAPNTTTVQVFIARADGSLDQAGAAVYL